MQQHPLRREIIATRLSNIITNEMGFTFVYRLQDETGAPAFAVVRAYLIARNILNLESILKQIENLGTQITAQKQIEMMMIYVRLSRRITRWFLNSHRRSLDISETVALYGAGIAELKKVMPKVYGPDALKKYEEQYVGLIEEGIPAELAHELSVTRGLFAAPDMIEIGFKKKVKLSQVAKMYFAIDEYLDLSWLRMQIIIHPTENNWESLSREALRDDLDWQQRQLTAGVMGYDSTNRDLDARLESWGQAHQGLVDRWRYILNELRSTPNLTFTMFFVAIRELLDLTQITFASYAELEQVASSA